MKSKVRQNQILLLFCMPALIVYFLFKLCPAVMGVFYALTDWNGLSRNYHFVGLRNFQELLSDTYYWNSIRFTLKYVIIMTVADNVVALLLGTAVESRKNGKSIYRTIFLMPNMISMIIGGYMWNFIFTKVLYYMADNWGWKFLDVSWIGDPHYSFLAICIVSAWGTVGYLMIIYIAALQGVPRELKESAALDGATKWQVFWKITFPLILYAVSICVFWTLNNTFQVFDVIYSLTGGGPGRATQSVALNIYEEAFRGNIRYGYATAKSTVLFLIVLAVTVIQLKVTGSKEQEL